MLHMEVSMYYFIVNEGARSGKGKEVWNRLQKILSDKNIEYKFFTTQYAGHAQDLSRDITSRVKQDLTSIAIDGGGTLDQNITLIAVGGDGTVNEVINGIADFSHVTFGVIPVGSGNDYARGLGLDKDPETNLLHLLENDETSAMDLGKVSWNNGADSRLFAISSGIGMDALVSKKALQSRLKNALNKIHLGKLTYILLTIETLFTMETADVTLTIPGHKALQLKKMIFLAAMNFRAEGGGVPMAPHAAADDGRLDLCIAYGIPKWVTFLLLPLLVLAKHENIKGFHIFRKGSCRVQTSVPMVVHTDGEYCGTFSDITYECLAGKLRIIK